MECLPRMCSSLWVRSRARIRNTHRLVSHRYRQPSSYYCSPSSSSSSSVPLYTPSAPQSLGAVQRLAERMASRAQPGDVFLLQGDVGAGKSVFARAFIRARCSDPHLEVTSPSFTLLLSYMHGGLSIHHADLYRLANSAAEVSVLELPSLYSGGITLVEWPERLHGLSDAPAEAVTVALAIAGKENTRSVKVSASDARVGKRWAPTFAKKKGNNTHTY
jgi:tRNA threonylcarbamoyladenosine biosynthesis protein TsaE